jgi:peptidoglycan hydrolase-like protein with peptidoglycan-binding domain
MEDVSTSVYIALYFKWYTAYEMIRMISRNLPNTFLIVSVFFVLAIARSSIVFAETVTGGGYIVEQVIAPIQGNITGNGYVLQQSAQSVGAQETGGGYTINSVFGTGTSSSTSTPPVTPPPTPVSTVYGGSYFVYPTPVGTTTSYVIYSSSSPPTVKDTGSTCSSRITFKGAIDIGSLNNDKEDVKKLEIFLNVYEKENLPINGIYEPRDIAAVKRWQKKYKSYILDPMLLKQPTGTIYTLSQRQIERQTTKPCGQPVVVTACPFFKEYASYGDKGANVKKIQQFLNVVRGEKLPLSGVYGPLTKAATKRFQQAYRKDIFNPLKLSFISGNWNEATRIKANQAIGCDIIK